jgi:hypothetical protein
MRTMDIMYLLMDMMRKLLAAEVESTIRSGQAEERVHQKRLGSRRGW